MIRDRGRIKWTSLMLPEHVRMLREWAREDEWEEGAELDEQRLEELDLIVQRAFTEGKQVVIRFFENHRSGTVTGMIVKIDPIEQVLGIRTAKREIEAIPIHSIEDIEIV